MNHKRVLMALIGLLFSFNCHTTNIEPSPETVFTSPPGIVIDYSPALSGIYLGSPGIASLPNGEYLAKADEFGPGSTERESAITRLYRSSDQGATWTMEKTFDGLFWASIFVHRDAVYLMGTTKQNGYTVILKSDDNGLTWSQPQDSESGLLLIDGGYHCAPVPIIVHQGKIWRAMEDAQGPEGWGSHFRAFMMSAPVNADLLKTSSWTLSNRIGRDPTLLEGRFGGWLEGNAVIAPDGSIVDVLRVDYRPEGGKAAIIRISEDGQKASFDPDTGFIDFPGGCKKFTIRFDPVSKLYWSLSNYVPPSQVNDNPERTRNTVALISSENLTNWQVKTILLHYPESTKHGFQYLDWLFEGEDIIAMSRTAFDDVEGGAHNQHDANYMTFHRFEGFRKLELTDSVVPIRDLGME